MLVPIFAELGGPMSLSQLLVLLAIVLITMMMLRSTYRRQKEQRANRPMADSLDTSHRAAQQARQIASDAEVHLHDMFRELGGRLDTKMHVLNELLIEADRKIAELRRLQGHRASAGNVAARQAASGEQPFVVEMEHSEASGANAKGDSSVETEEDERFHEIYQLADSGCSVAQISEQLSQPAGEIELILALRRRRDQASHEASGES